MDGSIIVGTAVCPGVVKLSERCYKSLYASVKRGMRLGFSYQLEVKRKIGTVLQSALRDGSKNRPDFPKNHLTEDTVYKLIKEVMCDLKKLVKVKEV